MVAFHAIAVISDGLMLTTLHPNFNSGVSPKTMVALKGILPPRHPLPGDHAAELRVG